MIPAATPRTRKNLAAGGHATGAKPAKAGQHGHWRVSLSKVSTSSNMLGPNPAPPRTSLARRRSTLRAAPPTMPLPPPSSKKHREPPRELATVCQKGNMLERNGATEKFDLPRRWKRILMCATISGSFRRGRAEIRSVRLTPELIWASGVFSCAKSYSVRRSRLRASAPHGLRPRTFFVTATMAVPARVPVKAAGRRISAPPRDPPANRSPRTRWSKPIRISVVTNSRRFGGAPMRTVFSCRRSRPTAIAGARAANDRIGHARHPLGLCGRVGALADRAPPPRLPAGGAGVRAHRLKRIARRTRRRFERASCHRATILRLAVMPPGWTPGEAILPGALAPRRPVRAVSNYEGVQKRCEFAAFRMRTKVASPHKPGSS